MEDKASLRKKYKELRASLNGEREKKSLLICRRAAEILTTLRADTVLLYSAIGSEADLTSLFEVVLERGMTAFFPRCTGEGEMTFFAVEDLSALQRGSYGIPEPEEGSPLEIWDSAVVFIPALAFDGEGYRLGYGGGYYDRFLSRFSGVKVGVAFDACVAERLPRESHDIKADYIITESQVKKLEN